MDTVTSTYTLSAHYVMHHPHLEADVGSFCDINVILRLWRGKGTERGTTDVVTPFRSQLACRSTILLLLLSECHRDQLLVLLDQPRFLLPFSQGLPQEDGKDASEKLPER